MFEWDERKNRTNQKKHGVDFEHARKAFLDPDRVIVEDLEHSRDEDRYFCLGRVEDEIITVRFAYRRDIVRIFGAGYWRKGKKRYEKENGIRE